MLLVSRGVSDSRVDMGHERRHVGDVTAVELLSGCGGCVA